MQLRKYQAKYKLAPGASSDLPIFTTPYYTIGEIVSHIKAMATPQYHINIWPFFLEYDIRNYGNDYQIPVYYFFASGK